jgi:hypothetical protein
MHEIHKRLMLTAREQRRLRTLLKLAIEAQEDAQHFGAPRAARPERQAEEAAS